MNDNDTILKTRLAAFDARPGPRVGDYLQIPKQKPRQSRWWAKIPDFTRFTHHWGDSLQTGGQQFGSYYLTSGGGLSYSGGLDPGLALADIQPEPCGIRPGQVWFFDRDISGAGRGVNFMADMRIFAVRDELVSLEGLHELRCPFSLVVYDERLHQQGCGHWYAITFHGMAHTAFRTGLELHAWLASEGLRLTQPLTPPGTHSWQALGFL